MGKLETQDRILYFGSGDARAARKGKWKYHLTDQRAWQQPLIEAPMLFDLETDPGETKNLINEFPDVAEQMNRVLLGYRAQIEH